MYQNKNKQKLTKSLLEKLLYFLNDDIYFSKTLNFPAKF